VKAWIFLFAVLAFGSMNADEKTAHATLGGGCFWCVEAVYETVPGILSVTSGYAGGDVPNPTYEQICTGRTGHAEVVRIEFDPSKITYEQVIDLFWDAHDPTTLNRQGPDAGPQYRSIILYEDESQKVIAEKSKKAAQLTPLIRNRSISLSVSFRGLSSSCVAGQFSGEFLLGSLEWTPVLST
jgi:peptide-methionine (S)-S-oxide reductase